MNLFCWSAGERKIEQHQSKPLVLVLSDTDIAGLDVAMGYAVAVEVVERFKKVFTQSFQHVDLKLALRAKALSESCISGVSHQDPEPAAKVWRSAQLRE